VKEKLFDVMKTYVIVVVVTTLYGVFFQGKLLDESLSNIGMVTFIYFISLLFVMVIEGIRRNW
jgi:hypothetical protein